MLGDRIIIDVDASFLWTLCERLAGRGAACCDMGGPRKERHLPPLARGAFIWSPRWEPGACLKVRLAREVFTFVDDSPTGGRGHSMPDAKLLSLASDLRARANELSARAETMYEVDAEQRMRAVAACHEKLAQQVEQHGAQGL